MNIIEDAALAAVPGGSGLKLALKLAPFLAIALLIGFVLWQRNTISTQKGDLHVAAQQIVDLTAANASAQATIDNFAVRQVDNDAIAVAVAAKLNLNRAQTEKVRVEMRKAQNDPTVRDWAAMPIPDLIRRLLNDEVTAPGSVQSPAR